MPLYEYECGKCAHKFEQRKSFSDGEKACCPQCNTSAQRVFTPVPIVFKGSGFYVTDYRKEKPPVEGSSESKPAPKAETKTEVKSEKPAGAVSATDKK